MTLAAAWEDHAEEWIAWARPASRDGFWDETWPALRELLPEPGSGPVIDIGCGEGRAGREPLKLGYQVVGVEQSPTLAVVHPFISAQDEDSMHTASPRFSRLYLQPRRYADQAQHNGLTMTFTSMHRPLSNCTSALLANGMMITALTEGGSGTIPWLLAIRAGKIAR